MEHEEFLSIVDDLNNHYGMGIRVSMPISQWTLKYAPDFHMLFYNGNDLLRLPDQTIKLALAHEYAHVIERSEGEELVCINDLRHDQALAKCFDDLQDGAWNNPTRYAEIFGDGTGLVKGILFERLQALKDTYWFQSINGSVIQTANWYSIGGHNLKWQHFVLETTEYLGFDPSKAMMVGLDEEWYEEVF